MLKILAKSPCLIGLLALAVGACAAKTADTAQPETPAADEPAGDAEKPDEAAKADGEDGEDAADAKADAKDDAKADAKAPAKGGGDVVAILAANPNTKTFSELLPLSDYGKGLHGTEGSGFTVLAPSDEAFAKLPKGTIDRWKKKPAELDEVIRYHVILGNNDVNKLTNFRTAPTASGKELEVKVSDNEITVQGAKLIETDLTASNGVVHVIDRVLKKK